MNKSTKSIRPAKVLFRGVFKHLEIYSVYLVKPPDTVGVNLLEVSLADLRDRPLPVAPWKVRSYLKICFT